MAFMLVMLFKKKKSKLNSDSVDIVVCVLLPVAQSTFISGKKLTSILIGQNHNSANVPKRKKNAQHSCKAFLKLINIL